jgi:ABC-type transporter Mla MlaB component
MLKLTVQETSTSLTLVLEGRLCREWVPEAQRVWDAVLESGRELVLDLSGVTFVDGDGELFLASVIAHGATVHSHGLLVGHLVNKLKRECERESAESSRAAPGLHRNPGAP